MKSDRRHELQTNSLALWLQLRLPELWNKYGSWVLLGLVVIMALVLFIQHRIKQPKIALANASRTLAEVQASVTRLEAQAVPLTEVSDVPARIDEAMKQSDKKEIQAYGNILKGEYYWALATNPVPPEAATRPSLRPEQSPEELVKLAEQSYEAALAVAPDAQDLVARAHFGLANIAETRGYEPVRTPGQVKADSQAHFDTARRHFEAVAKNDKMIPSLKAEANWRLEQLALLSKPVWLQPWQPQTNPTSLPSLDLGPLGPELPPTRPATRAAAAVTGGPVNTLTRPTATRPATAPAK